MRIFIYTDGACSGNPGKGAWAAVITDMQNYCREIAGFVEATTNNRMEMQAVIESLKTLSEKELDVEIQVFTDSKYLINGITQYIHQWLKNGWRKSDGNEVLNRDLWQMLWDLVKNKNLNWKYVPGHQGYVGNERANSLAQDLTQGLSIDLYSGTWSGYGLGRGLKSDLDSEIVLSKKPSSKRESGYPIYLSYVDCQLRRHKDWPSCESLVKGVPGALYKKVLNFSEEQMILKKWGLELA